MTRKQIQTVVHPTMDKLQATVYTKRIRCEDFFKDFDRLRTGIITRAQFERCLNQIASNLLSAKEIEDICTKYKKSQMEINYRAFIDDLDSIFATKRMEKNPTARAPEPEKLLQRMKCNLHDQDEMQFQRVLHICRDYCQYHSIVVQSTYADLDRHRNGLVTKSQFIRNFPGPSCITEDEINLLIQKYFDTTTGLVNYREFHRDVCSPDGGDCQNVSVLTPREEYGRIVEDEWTADEIIAKYRVIVYQKRVCVDDFFKDYDKLRSGLISETQFVRVLKTCLNCTMKHAGALVKEFRASDGRIKYREFSKRISDILTPDGMLSNPLKEFSLPTREDLVREVNDISPEKEARHAEIVKYLSEKVSTRRILLQPFFKDYDKKHGSLGRITQSHFFRLLTVLDLDVDEEDKDILIEKYCDKSNNYDINYLGFLRNIDTNFGNGADSQGSTSSDLSGVDSIPRFQKPKEKIRSGQEMKDHIIKSVFKRQLRTSDFFRDFDKLRSGSISKAQFFQCITAMCNDDVLCEEELEALAAGYTHPGKKGMVRWVKFSDEIEEVVKAKEATCHLSERTQRHHGSANRKTLTEEEQAQLAELLDTLGGIIKQKRVLVKPILQDFDKHNHGTVSKQQLIQSLSYLGLTTTPEEIQLLQSRFTTPEGRFDYVEFIGCMGEKAVDHYDSGLPFKHKETECYILEEPKVAQFEDVLNKMKAKAYTERIKVHEFLRDYDKLRSSRIHKTTFRRAIGLCFPEITEEEAQLVMAHFQNRNAPDDVDYLDFCVEIESVFTTHNLLANPTKEVLEFDPATTRTEQQFDKLDLELKGYRNNMIKESIRMGHNDLGDFHYERGELAQALKCYSRTRDYCTTSRHIVQMCLNVIKVSMELGNWAHVLTYVSKAENTPDIQEDLVVVAKLKCCAGLAHLAFKKYKRAGICFLEASYDYSNALPEVIAAKDVAVYGGLCALATFDRSELKEKVKNNNVFKLYLELEPEIRELMNDFYESKYRSCLNYLDAMKDDLLLDMCLSEHVEPLYEMIRSRAIIQYFSPFLSVDLSRMAEDFNTTVNGLESELTALIMNDMINARIDSHNKVLHARKVSQRTIAFKKAMEVGEDYKRHIEVGLLQIALKKNNFSINAGNGNNDSSGQRGPGALDVSGGDLSSAIGGGGADMTSGMATGSGGGGGSGSALSNTSAPMHVL
eukprot:Nk52_evm54s62 gene=Nk52_evmTU54s62